MVGIEMDDPVEWAKPPAVAQCTSNNTSRVEDGTRVELHSKLHK